MYYDLPLDHPDRGRAFPCDCTASVIRDRQKQRLLAGSGLGALSRMTFDSFDLRQNELPYEQYWNLYKVWSAVEEYANSPWPRGWLVLYGTYGCGKTHLAAAAVNHRITVLGRPALFVVVPDFLGYLRSTFNPSGPGGGDEYFQRVKTIDFLVLDDLGAENSTPWVNETLFQLVNYRYNNELPTVFTSNVDVENVGDRIRSRMLDNSFTERWVIQAPDFRLTAKTVVSGFLQAGDDNGQVPAAASASRPRRVRGAKK